jgi:hypothetical protein
MKTILYSFLAVATLAAVHAATAPEPVKPRDITTKDGTTYHHATIMGSTSTTAMLSCDEGTVYVEIEKLPADIQKEIGWLGPGGREKAEAEKAAEQKALAQQAEQEKKAKIESSKHELLPGTEKDPWPQLNPDFFPAELSSQISAYNTKAQYNMILSKGARTPDTDATIEANAGTLTALHAIYLDYKKFMENPPAGINADAARKAVADLDYEPYGGMPEIVLQAIMGPPDKVVNVSVGEVKYVYGKSEFTFIDGKYAQRTD